MSKAYHRAAKINGNGGVSALCFRNPRAIDLKRACWTLLDSQVTCKKCLRLIAARSTQQRSDQS